MGGGGGERLLSNVLFTGSWTYNLGGGAYKFCQFLVLRSFLVPDVFAFFASR